MHNKKRSWSHTHLGTWVVIAGVITLALPKDFHGTHRIQQHLVDHGTKVNPRAVNRRSLKRFMILHQQGCNRVVAGRSRGVKKV